MFSAHFVITYSLLVNSFVDFRMVSTRKKRQENKMLLSQLSESDTNFMIGQSNYEAQLENRIITTERTTTLNNTTNPTQVNRP